MKLEQVKNEMIREYLGETNLDFNGLSLEINSDISVEVFDPLTQSTLIVNQCFTDLQVYLDNEYLGTFCKRDNQWIKGSNFCF